MSINELHLLYKQFESIVQQQQLQLQQQSTINDGNNILSKLKLLLIKCNAQPPFIQQQQVNQDLLNIGVSIYEQAIIYTLKTYNFNDFNRYINIIKTYYYDYSINTNDKTLIMSLYLLYLLTDNQIEQFYIELELIQKYYIKYNELINNKLIYYTIELEQYLMDGSYNKILNTQPPNPLFNILIDKLKYTVTQRIADGIEIAYNSINVNELKKLLLINDDKLFNNIVNDRQWNIQGSNVVFNSDSIASKYSIPSYDTIKYTLTYANELEKIV